MTYQTFEMDAVRFRLTWLACKQKKQTELRRFRHAAVVPHSKLEW